MRGRSLALIALIAASGVAVRASNQEGEAFLKENASQEGVVVLASGLQYKVLKSGAEGARQPGPRSPCKVCVSARARLSRLQGRVHACKSARAVKRASA